MVSLGTNFNTMHSAGAQNFREEEQLGVGGAAIAVGSSGNSGTVGIGISSDRQELLDPVLSADDDGSFKPLKTIPAFSIHLLISTAISLAGIVLAATWKDDKRCEAYFIMLYLRATFWVITFLFDHVIKKHHDYLRMNGYHEFHRATAMHKGVPLIVVSLWNTTLLAVQALIHHFYGEKFWEHCVQGWLSPITYVTAFNVVETLVLVATHGCYIAKVLKFNRAKHAPDALRGVNNASGSLGLMQPGNATAELLEKQADLIAYLKDHNMKLNQKLHQMQLNARTVTISQ